MKDNPRKQQILKTAYKRFIKHGLAKTSIEEIARDLRLGKATIYHYFKSKEEIFYETVRNEINRFKDDISQLFDSPDIELKNKLAAYLQKKIDSAVEYPLIYTLLNNIIKNSALDIELELLGELLTSEKSIVNLLLQKEVGEKEMNEKFEMLIKFFWAEPFIKSLSSANSNLKQPLAEVLAESLIKIIK